MDGNSESKTFHKMNVMLIKKFLLERGVSVKGYHKSSLIKIASAVKKMGLPCVPNVNSNRHCVENEDILIIHEMDLKIHSK